MKTNRKNPAIKIYTYEGSIAMTTSPKEELRRAVLTCLLFENTFYEKGSDIAKRIEGLVHMNDPQEVATLASDARNKYGLRHVSLFLARELARHKHKDKIKVSAIIDDVVQRADELAEFVSLYWRDGRQPLSAQVKKGLAKAFTKFSPYNLAKYNRDSEVKLRDVMFLVNPKPKDEAQAEAWKKLVLGTLEAPDTWEVALSAGADKKATWERLIAEKKLGGLATLRNLRNMLDAKVDKTAIALAISQANYKGVLPFQFFAAAKAAPSIETLLEPQMYKAVESLATLPGMTYFLVDVSGSMEAMLSHKGTLTRFDAASALAVLLREKCEKCRVYTFSDNLVEVAPRRGFALRDGIVNSQRHGATYLARALSTLRDKAEKPDRIIVLTDEQSHDGGISAWTPKAYSMNVAPYKPGLNYGNGWTHINGWSERLVDYIVASEASE